MSAFSSLRYTVLVAMLLVAAGCSTSRYQQSVDSVPDHRSAERMTQIFNAPEPEPVREPISPRGNADEYEVWGKTYQVQKELTGYSQAGTASWYGQKFHGHETSNGEIFDVYEFTAAHKSLPLPSYVRVTNLSNNKSLVVRVNDRGPFHGDRLIDLSYAAAVRLGFEKQGTADVHIELLAPPLMDADYKHIQVEAFSQKTSAETLKLKIENALARSAGESVNAPVYIYLDQHKGQVIHKVRIGPVAPEKVQTIQDALLAKALNPGLVLPLNFQAPDLQEKKKESDDRRLLESTEKQMPHSPVLPETL